MPLPAGAPALHRRRAMAADGDLWSGRREHDAVPAVEISTVPRIGIVVRRSTMPGVRYNPANNSLRPMGNFLLKPTAASAPLH